MLDGHLGPVVERPSTEADLQVMLSKAGEYIRVIAG